MRLPVGVLVLLGLGGLSCAWADEPNSSSAPPSAPSVPPTPAAPVAPAAAAASPTAVTPTPAAPALDQTERHLMAEGYRMEMRNGQKIYCRKEELLGSRVSGKKVCGTAGELMTREDQSRDAAKRAQRTGGVPRLDGKN